MRTSIYNMLRNSWRSIRLVSDGLEPSFRFGATIVPVFNKHVTIREQVEMAKNVQPRPYGPVPLFRILILGGVSLEDYVAATGGAAARDRIKCTTLHFTNSNKAPFLEEANSEDSKDVAKKSRKKRK